MYILLANTAKVDTLAVAKNSREVTTTQFGSTDKFRLLHKHLPTYRKTYKTLLVILIRNNTKHLQGFRILKVFGIFKKAEAIRFSLSILLMNRWNWNTFDR